MAVNNGLSELTSAVSGLQLVSLSEQLQELRAIQDSLRVIEMSSLNSARFTGGSEGSGGSSLSTALSTAGSFLGGGLGIASLISGVAGLFAGNDRTSAPAFMNYLRPGAIHAEGGVSAIAGGQVFAEDRGQSGLPRAITTAQPQITLQVQALDSRSFLDRSHEIALAVRQAMLETGVLNDVIREV